MMWGLEIGVFALVVVVAQYLLWRFLRRHDEPCQVRPEPAYRATLGSAHEYAFFLRHYGTEQQSTDLPEEAAQLHPLFADLFRRYSGVRLDVDESVYHRRFVGVYALNPDYVLFGEWPDGSAVLARRSADDPVVYIDDIEDNRPGDVRPLAESLSAYFRAAAEVHGVKFPSSQV